MPASRSRRGGLVLLASLVLVVAASWSAEGNPPPDDKATRTKMKGWAADLGVKCSYCHAAGRGRELDYKARTALKEIAHYCDEHFVKALSVQGHPVACADCHARRARFLPRQPGDNGPSTPGNQALPPLPGSESPGGSRPPGTAQPPAEGHGQEGREGHEGHEGHGDDDDDDGD